MKVAKRKGGAAVSDDDNDEGGEDRLEIHGSLGCGVVEKRMTRANR